MPFSVSVVRAAYRPRPWSLRGEVSATLAEEIELLDADLVVMATRGRGAIGRFWRGSIAYSLLERIKVPLVLVRGHQQPVNSKPKRIDHAILALDGTESAERLLSSVLDLDALSSARHTLLRILSLTDVRKFKQAGADP